jgi:hypothetical protein
MGQSQAGGNLFDSLSFSHQSNLKKKGPDYTHFTKKPRAREIMGLSKVHTICNIRIHQVLQSLSKGPAFNREVCGQNCASRNQERTVEGAHPGQPGKVSAGMGPRAKICKGILKMH